uniref:Nodule-specific cysteine-rich peptide G19 n=1 Tax=Pisum sativum TaxID=3888 RepID=A0A7T8DV38_PEA|nr:nodule-specific cysteine-rich peptide G19 [Pisum sativum]
MVEVVKFVYVIIIFLCLIPVGMNDDELKSCTQDSDCPKSMCLFPLKPKCYMFVNPWGTCSCGW